MEPGRTWGDACFGIVFPVPSGKDGTWERYLGKGMTARLSVGWLSEAQRSPKRLKKASQNPKLLSSVLFWGSVMASPALRSSPDLRQEAQQKTKLLDSRSTLKVLRRLHRRPTNPESGRPRMHAPDA